MESGNSHIDFANHITEDDTLNYFNFPFLYLGGGVSVGDINNDGLPDLYFTGNQVSNRLYLNKGNLVFEDITKSARVGGDDRWYSGSTMIDINHDGWLDIYVSVAGKFGKTANQLFVNQGNNTFIEEAESYGIADKATSIQSTFFDYDNDGLLDLFVANYPIVRVSAGNQYYKDKMEENRLEDSGHLYRNEGNGRFKDVTVSAGVRNFGLSLGIVAADFNNDGFQDLYVSNDFNVPDFLYQNNGDGTFSEVSQLATRHTAMFGMGIDAADFNNDGLLDLVQLDMTAEDYKRAKTNMASMQPETFHEAVDMGFHFQYMQNVLQVNNGVNSKGHPIFSDISRLGGVATTDWSWGVIFADLDNDGKKDMFISNGVKRDVNNNDVNLNYESTTFFGREENPDFRLMPSSPIANYTFANRGDFTFSNVSKEWGLDQEGFSNGFVISDLDNDGDLDLVINNLDATASVYENELEQRNRQFLKIKLIGPEYNPLGLGTKLWVKAGGIIQTQELSLSRGYQSSTDPVLHFGLGSAKNVDELKLRWPDGKMQSLSNLSANQIIQVDYQESDEKEAEKQKELSPFFTNRSSQAGMDFIHKEDDFNDFEFEPLLPHKNSHVGPSLTVGDINNDGLEDFFIGNATAEKAAMYWQNKEGKFEILKGPWEEDADFEDTGALLFDADKDSDLDLYVVSGGNDKLLPPSYYQDRLYIQTKSGFVKAKQSLPSILSSGSTVISADYDLDGDLDLFVGGRIIPGKYPYPAQSYILRNEGGTDTDLRYTDVTEELAPQLISTGLVTAALWDDFDLDGKPDLILCGEWMPVRFFRNTGTTFEEITSQIGLDKNVGWWYSLQKADIDADGDMDYLAGNLGLNYKYKSSKDKPFEIYTHDFDENGKEDIVLSYEHLGTKVPLRGRECSSQQVPAIKMRFKTYELFADASLADIYDQRMLDQSLHYAATSFAHCWFENKGDSRFELHQLPLAAQISSVNTIEIFDYNQDTYPDLLIAGNLYQAEVETPRADASLGLVLTGNKTKEFDPIPAALSRLMLEGEVKDIEAIQMASGEQGFLVARNDLPLQLWVFGDQTAY